VAGIRQTWLKDGVTEFLIGFVGQGFKRPSLQDFARRLRAFGEFAERHGVNDPAQLDDHVEPFVRPIHQPRKRRAWRNFLHQFARFAGAPPAEPARSEAGALDRRTQLVEEYAAFLREHRGLRPKTVATARFACTAFLGCVADDGCADLAALQPGSVHRFIVAQSKRYSRSTLRSRCCTIRGFLNHLYRRRAIASDLSGAVIVPREYKQERCPRFLTRAEVEAVLAAIDRGTPRGKRTYAMLMLLANYGLRGGEVRALRLDHIDWRNDRIRIAGRKAANATDYPLTAPVGEAILDYLEHGRPAGTHREVFLTVIAPVKPMSSTSPIAYQVCKYLARAGVTVARPGTHSFRYSCAQRLLDGGTSLKVIGDYLGHTHPDSTQRYTKIAIEQLREVAQGDVEELL
jgi:site-specific recombinase XerD